MLKVSNLTAGYGKMPIVREISFEVSEGELLSILGPNGSGKSTLMRSIMGLTQIFEGKVYFGDKEITGNAPEEIARLGLGYVPQVSNVFPDMTVFENLELGLLAYRGSSIRREVMRSVLELFPNLIPKLNEKASVLSGGERQILAIARALMAEPRFLILDEPSAGLAPVVAEKLFQKLQDMKKRGITLVLVEQNVRKALSFSQRIIVLVQGRKVFEGSPSYFSNEREIARLFLGSAIKRE